MLEIARKLVEHGDFTMKHGGKCGGFTMKTVEEHDNFSSQGADLFRITELVSCNT
jgi:hypothetical protein